MPFVDMRWCASCQDDRAFEVPPCEDGHGLDCLDLACVDCGHAVVIGLHSEGVAAAESPLLEVYAA